MALPCNDTRDGLVVVARDITLRDTIPPPFAVRDAVFVVPRDTTLRDAVDVVPRDAAFTAFTPRDDVAIVGRPDVVAVARDADVVALVAGATAAVVAARDTTAREDAFARGDCVTTPDVVSAPRDTIFAELPRDVAGRDAVPARCAWGNKIVAWPVGAIGSANTARIDNNVEHTKNAPASRNIVPIAFFNDSAKLRLFIKLSLKSGNDRKTRCFGYNVAYILPVLLYNYIIFTAVCK